MESKLISDISKLQKEIANSSDQEQIEQHKHSLVEKEKSLNEIIDTRIKGILIRAKAEQIEFDGKNSKYFANLEKKKSEQKLISKLNVNGNMLTNQSDIRQAQYNFYKSLYDEKLTQESNINFFNDNINKLNNDEKNICEGMLTDYECGIALKEMNNSKSHGSDGITTEFYKTV